MRRDPETRLIFVGDATMAPYELTSENGSIYYGSRESISSADRLQLLARTFRHAVWLNPRSETQWFDSWTLGVIGNIFPMYELTLDGLEKAVQHLMRRN